MLRANARFQCISEYIGSKELKKRHEHCSLNKSDYEGKEEIGN